MPSNRSVPRSLHPPPSLSPLEVLDWAEREILTYSPHCTVPQFHSIKKKFQGWMEERLDCCNGESQRGERQAALSEHNHSLSYD